MQRVQLWCLVVLVAGVCCAGLAAAQTCPASFFGSAASAYNVFLLGSTAPANNTFDLTNGEVEGRVASSGNFRAINCGIGTRLGNCAASTPTLVIGGAHSIINFSGGLQCGSLIAESSATITSLPGFANGQLVQGSVSGLAEIDFAAVKTQLQAQAASLCAAGGVAAGVSGTSITLTGSASASLAFTVNVADINRASSLTLTVPNARAVEQVVINIVGSSAINIGGFQTFLNGVSSGLVTYVVCDAPTVTIKNFGLSGNLLAPSSAVTIQNAQLLGNVVALVLTGIGSGEVHLPVCPSPAPSPSTSPTSSASPSAAASRSPSPAASISSSPSISPSPSAAASPSASPSPAVSRSPAASASASPAVSPSPSIVSTPQPSLAPSAIPSPSCPPSFFGGAAAFNVFLSGNANKQFAFNMTNGEVWGKVAVNGSVFARSFGFGTRLTCTGNTASQATLIVSGPTVNCTGEIQCGNLVTSAATTVTGLSFRNGQAITGDITTITGVDFAAIASSLATASSSLCSGNTSIAATVGASNRVTFVGTSAAIQTFTITTAQLRSATSIGFTFADVSVVQQVVINVVGTDAVVFFGFDINLGGVANRRITWNVCSATSVSVNNFNFQGNLLAPLADVSLTNAQINGNVAARTLTGVGSGEVHLPQCP